MLLYISLILLSPLGILMFQQHDYNITFERLEVSATSKDFVQRATTHNFKHNRTYTAVNITLKWKKDFKNNIQVVYQAYKMASNEYRLFPLRYMDNFCTAVARNDYGLRDFVKCGNVTCPPKKGIYTICNWAPDQTRFPPHIPNGSYKIELLLSYEGVQVLVFEAYGTVTRQIPWN